LPAYRKWLLPVYAEVRDREATRPRETSFA